MSLSFVVRSSGGTCRRSPSAFEVKPSSARSRRLSTFTDAVDLVREIVAVSCQYGGVVPLQGAERTDLRIHGKRPRITQRLHVRRERRSALDRPELMVHNASSRRSDRRVLRHGPAAGTRVGEETTPACPCSTARTPSGMDLPLTSSSSGLSLQPLRDGVDGGDVRGDVLADLAVATVAADVPPASYVIEMAKPSILSSQGSSCRRPRPAVARLACPTRATRRARTRCRATSSERGGGPRRTALRRSRRRAASANRA